MYDQEPWFDRTHNVILDWLIAGGAVGLLSYISMFVAMLYYIRKAGDDFLRREDKAIILGLLAAYVFHNLFVFDQIGSYIFFFTLLGYVHAHTPETTQKYWDKLSSKLRAMFDKENYRAIYESVAVILIILIIYFVNYVPWQQNKELLNVLALANQGQIGALGDYSKPLKKNTLGFSEALEHVSQTAIGLNQNLSAPAELKEGLFKKLDESFVLQLEKAPNDARYRLFYGLFLSRFGWYGRALEQLERASELSPNKQSMYFELVSNFLLEGKTSEALAKAKIAYELNPAFTEAKFIYGLTALAAGDNVTSQKLLAEIDQTTLLFDDRYISILLSLKRFEDIIEIAKGRIALDPTNLQHRITLTAAYLQANRRSEAILTLEEMINLDPSFKERGEYYINEIKAGRNP